MNELVQVPFDYGMLTPEQAQRTQDREIRIIGRTQKAIIENGKDLLAVKEDIGHGHFLIWVQSIGMSPDTAQRYMNVAENFREIPQSAVFDKAALYLLSVSKVPESAREEARQRAELGEKITEEIARQIRDAHRAKEEAEQKAEKIEQESLLALMLANDRVTDAQASARLLEGQVEANQSEIAQLTQRIAELEQERATPQIVTQEVTKEVIPPETQQKLADLEKKVAEAATLEKKLKEERDEKAAQLKQKTERLKMLYEEMSKHTAITEQQKHREEIRFKWRQCCDAFHLGINQAFARLVTPLDAKVAFESDDWARLTEIEATLRQALEHLARLRESVTSQFVDTSMEYVEA